jgi:hypothetical protein
LGRLAGGQDACAHARSLSRMPARVLACVQVLAGKLKPNMGRFENPPDWQEILAYFRGNELQNYFTRVLEDDLKV